MARNMIGDCRIPALYFVTDRGTVVTVTYNPVIAYAHFKLLKDRQPLMECAVEDSENGVLYSLEPTEDSNGKLVMQDDFYRYIKNAD